MSNEPKKRPGAKHKKHEDKKSAITFMLNNGIIDRIGGKEKVKEKAIEHFNNE